MRHTIELTPEQERSLTSLARDSGASPERAIELILAALFEVNPNVTDQRLIFEELGNFIKRAAALDDELPIRSTPGVMGGDACIRKTRIPVWTLIDYKRMGLSDAQLLEAFPILNIADLAAAWDYYAAHGDEVDAQRKRHEDAA